jgi:hypothetical protein
MPGMPKKSVEEPRWEISRLAARAVFVGHVKAADAAAAIKRAIELYQIPERYHARLIARQTA